MAQDAQQPHKKLLSQNWML